jgi:hypothetical protein
MSQAQFYSALSQGPHFVAGSSHPMINQGQSLIPGSGQAFMHGGSFGFSQPMTMNQAQALISVIIALVTLHFSVIIAPRSIRSPRSG